MKHAGLLWIEPLKALLVRHIDPEVIHGWQDLKLPVRFYYMKEIFKNTSPPPFFKWLPAEVLKFCTTARLQALKWASWIPGPIPDWSLLFMGHDWWTTSKFVSKIRGLEMFFRSTRKYNLVNSYRETYHVWKIVSVVDFSFDVNRDEQSNYFYT